MPQDITVIDDLHAPPPAATIGTCWQVRTDRVMGGVSEASMRREVVGGRPAIRMQGEVRLENNGGFVQMALDLAPPGELFDASAWRGLELSVLGNDHTYAVHLRTDALARPWQSYRQSFKAPPVWQTLRLAFDAFVPYRTDRPLDLRRLRRLGVVAIGSAFHADLSLGGIRLYP